MTYYLQHYFDPDFDHLAVKPKISSDGRADRYNLGYVQNVVRGQILAEMMTLGEDDNAAEYPQKYLLDEPVFPAGANTTVDPSYPHYLLADANGYAFYLDGKITVKNVLNVRGDINFRTGNIFFVGNLAVHGDLKAGFKIQANDVLIMGMVEGGIARARHDLAVKGGVRGGSGTKCLLDARNSLRVSHAESAELRCHSRLMIEKFCLHSRLYVAGDVLVQDRLYGGTCQSGGTVMVRGELGNASEAPTKIHLRSDPFLVRQLERVEGNLHEMSNRIMHYTAVAGHLPPDANDTAKRLAAARYKQKCLQEHRDELYETLSQDDKHVSRCRVIVPGLIHPGVTIVIGRSVFDVHEPMRNVMFRLVNESIKPEPIPAGTGVAHS